MIWTWWANDYPDTIDFALYLAICIPALFILRGQMLIAAAFLLSSALLVKGYEHVMDTIPMAAFTAIDFACAAGLSWWLLHYHYLERLNKAAVVIAFLFWACVAIDSMTMMGVAPELSNWWIIRLINYAQLATLGGGIVIGRGGKHSHRRDSVLRVDRGHDRPVAARMDADR